jgi:superfamily I DNA/RNA helicase
MPAISSDNLIRIVASLGDGHRILRGVAGSGKTLILAFRAEYLARAATKPVLMLCFANGIAGRLENAMRERGVEDRVQVCTFHSWCYRMLWTYDIPSQPRQSFQITTRGWVRAFAQSSKLSTRATFHWDSTTLS